ncbi:cache domain-containing protein [Paraglaciecola aquimarina]|uniref:cache domain-containing protein n=1 Tax=Paraglaciecola aquimarina TaxID=1235557 RepID=UPI003D1765D5
MVIGLFEASLNISVKTEVESRLHETADHIDAQMQEQLDKYRRDIRFLHETPPISGLVRAMKYNGIDPDSQNTYQQWAEQLQTTFVAFMEHNQEYDQIRIISGNEDGLELVRVERVLGKIQRVKASQLQSKKDRDYFSASLQLAEGELYMSQFSLNREFGQIEVPYRPTLRISIPIFINEHQRLGFLILNINAQPILDSLVLMAGNQFQLVMTDNDGYYLVSPNDREKFSRDLAPELQWQNSYQMEEAIAQDFTKVVRADDVSTVFYAYEKKVRVAGISEDGFLLIRVLALSVSLLRWPWNVVLAYMFFCLP